MSEVDVHRYIADTASGREITDNRMRKLAEEDIAKREILLPQVRVILPAFIEIAGRHGFPDTRPILDLPQNRGWKLVEGYDESYETDVIAGSYLVRRVKSTSFPAHALTPIPPGETSHWANSSAIGIDGKLYDFEENIYSEICPRPGRASRTVTRTVYTGLFQNKPKLVQDVIPPRPVPLEIVRGEILEGVLSVIAGVITTNRLEAEWAARFPSET
ncbi:MAG: hypothetical protein WD887_01800 [Candidatus Saccharimonadales bacterium]